jgi:cardiolipin synthase
MNRIERDSIFSIPNAFSLTRILLIPVFILAVLQGRPKSALIIFLIASSTDFLDGASARLLNQKTKLGSLLDPAGDKLFMTAAFLVLSIPALNAPNVLPIWLTAIVIGRDVMLVTGAVVLYVKIGRKSFPPSLIGKGSTVWQFTVLLLVLWFNTLNREAGFLIWIYAFTALLTIIAGGDYVRKGLSWLQAARGTKKPAD